MESSYGRNALVCKMCGFSKSEHSEILKVSNFFDAFIGQLIGRINLQEDVSRKVLSLENSDKLNYYDFTERVQA